MIRLESAHIEEVRGIRKLDIDFRKETFAISGPNGSGKSGVIDAIEFGLTGEIGRLTGRGMKGLPVAEHGPHVDKTKFPDASFIQLKVFIPSLGKSATITRKISSPKKPEIMPADADAKAVLDEIADHPEITLSRREILRFILVEPTKRSEEIQTILKLEQIGQTRGALNTAQNKLQTAQRTAAAQVQSSRETLQRHLQISTFHSADLLEAVNLRREVLGLPSIEKLTADTKVDASLADTGKAPEFNKQSILRDLKALTAASRDFSDLGRTPVAAILFGIARLEADPALFDALQRRSFIETGLELADGPECPLCDHPWDNQEHLRDHLKAKLAKSEEAGRLHEALLKAGSELGREGVRVIGLLTPALKIAEAQDDQGFARLLAIWKLDLEELKTKLTAFDGLWNEISAALAKGKVEVAAAGLRHHLEYASRHLADHLGARPVFKADGNYELGELLPSVLSRMKYLCGKAAEAAQSWGNSTAKEAAAKLKTTLSGSSAASNVEQWAVNKAVHYNEWANFGKKDFEPVVTAFRELLECFRCKDCQSWLYVTPRGIPESLRCPCSSFNINLKTKPK